MSVWLDRCFLQVDAAAMNLAAKEKGKLFRKNMEFVVTKMFCVIGWFYYEQLPPATTESSAAPI